MRHPLSCYKKRIKKELKRVSKKSIKALKSIVHRGMGRMENIENWEINVKYVKYW